jgi:hypothetical protein
MDGKRPWPISRKKGKRKKRFKKKKKELFGENKRK